MTNEEAILYWQQLKEVFSKCHDQIRGETEKENFQKYINYIDAALDALRAVPDRNPLTLEQLREMDGKPVWIDDLESSERNGWYILYWDRGKYLVLLNKYMNGFLLDEYGKTWLAHAFPPARIDREAWTAEWIYPENEWNLPECSKCGCNSEDAQYKHKNNFCPKCGRAMTPEAWAEMEKQLKG